MDNKANYGNTVGRYSGEQAERFFGHLIADARRVPGVDSAALTRYMPMDGLPPSVNVVPEGYQFPPGKNTASHARSVPQSTNGLPPAHSGHMCTLHSAICAI